MAILDINNVLSSAQAVTVTAPSTTTYDVAGVGVGNAPPNTFGTATLFGEDIGIGDGVSPPRVAVYVGTAFTAGGAATLQLQLQASIDTGTPGYTPSAWRTIGQTEAIAVASLTANALIMEMTVPPRAVGQAFPRFYRLNYVVATGPMTAGTIAWAGFLTGVDNAPQYAAAY